MKTITEIKQQLIVRQAAAESNRQAVSLCTRSTLGEAHEIITTPLALAVSFGTGWFVGSNAQRPKQVKQAKNVTIKRSSMTSELIKMVAPYAISALQTGNFFSETPQASSNKS